MVFWEDRNVIVTGGAGFLGSYEVEKLAERGAGSVFVPRSADYDLRAASARERIQSGSMGIRLRKKRHRRDVVRLGNSAALFYWAMRGL